MKAPKSHRHRRPPKPGPTRKRPEKPEPAVGTLPPWGESDEEGKAR